METWVDVLDGMWDILWECTAIDSAHGDAEGAGLEDIMVGEGLLAVVGGLSGLTGVQSAQPANNGEKRVPRAVEREHGERGEMMNGEQSL